ncbi:MAG TPA: hypothetical protein VIM22_03950 [Solirubrobacteraceae bacterium]
MTHQAQEDRVRRRPAFGSEQQGAAQLIYDERLLAPHDDAGKAQHHIAGDDKFVLS